MFGSSLILKNGTNNIYEPAPPHMHVLRALCVLLAVLPPALCDTTTFVDESTCDGTVSLHGSMDNDVLYNQVYNWMHQNKISDWTHKRVEASATLRAHFAVADNATLACAEVSYVADLQLPDSFKSFLQHLGLATTVPIAVRKTVCNTGASLLEQAEVDAAVVRRVYIDATHEFNASCPACETVVSSSTDVRMDVPWYARMLTRMITQHIGVSVGEKTRAVAASLCTARAGPALLERNASFLTPPLEARKRRRRAGDVANGTAPRLWRLRHDAGASLPSAL